MNTRTAVGGNQGGLGFIGQRVPVAFLLKLEKGTFTRLFVVFSHWSFSHPREQRLQVHVLSDELFDDGDFVGVLRLGFYRHAEDF